MAADYRRGPEYASPKDPMMDSLKPENSFRGTDHQGNGDPRAIHSYPPRMDMYNSRGEHAMHRPNRNDSMGDQDHRPLGPPPQPPQIPLRMLTPSPGNDLPPGVNQPQMGGMFPPGFPQMNRPPPPFTAPPGRFPPPQSNSHMMPPNLPPPPHMMPPPNMGYTLPSGDSDMRINQEPMGALPDLSTPFYQKRRAQDEVANAQPPKTMRVEQAANKIPAENEPFDRALQMDHRNAEKITVLDQYWQMLKHSPHDFHSWTYLLEHVETLDDVGACRGVFNAFLPLYPYCYAYWLRYSDLERKHQHPDRALRILEKALEAIPLSADLWLSYLNLYWELYRDTPQAESSMRRQCERAIAAAGLDFRSDALWEAYISWEADFRRLRQMTTLYRRVINRPTRLYNKHWDAFIQHVRDNNPQEILSPDEYSRLRAEALGELAKTAPGEVATEERVSVIMRERFLAALIPYHLRTEAEVERRWKFEEKIRRPYFHVKPLDKRQLSNWREYIEWETGCGDHERIVLLYERCLIACAHYEEFWCKYARYMERHRARNLKGEVLKKNVAALPVMDHDQLRDKARAALSTEPPTDALPPSMGERGFGEDHIPRKEMHSRDVPHDHIQREMGSECLTEIKSQELRVEGSTGSVNSLKETGGDSVEAIRELYRRATVIHCPNKPTVSLQWAQFEEEQSNLEKARELITNVEENHPGLLVAAVQRIDLERRQGKMEVVLKLYKSYMDNAPTQLMKSWFAIKFARFTFKVMNAPDGALKILRMSLKKDRGNHLLYQAVLELCYQRQPTDAQGFCAAADLGINSSHLSPKHKLEFARRKEQFLHEFGDLVKLREASDQVERCEREIPETEKSTRDRGVNCDLLPSVSNHTKEKKKKKDKEHKKKKKEKHSSESKKDKSEEKYVSASVEERGQSQEKHKKRQKRKESGDDDEDEEGLIKDDDDKKDGRLADGIMSPENNHKDKPPSPSLGTQYPMLPDPAEKRCINVPEWFEGGGELMIGETTSGMSVLRYWPHFLNEKLNGRLFRTLRRFVKWSNIPMSRLLAWYGPCDYEYNGNLLSANSDWSPDMIDLLSRINQLTGHEFNSCLVSHYRHGNDWMPWETADSPALGRNPPLATISLGGSRVIELCKRAGPAHAIRLPLRPGSLLVLEGATQSDWCQQIPRDSSVREEVMSLSFRVMYHLPPNIY